MFNYLSVLLYYNIGSMQEAEFIWMDGKLVKWNEAKIHLLTHSLHYGTAVFEGIRCYETPKGSAIFRLKDHVKRLLNSQHIVGMDCGYSAKELEQACKQVVKENKLKECYVRPLIYYGYGSMGIDTRKAPVNVGIAAFNFPSYLGKEGLDKGIRAKVSSFTRPHPNTMMTKAKVSGNYANSTFAKMEALNSGFQEAIILDSQGYVSECSAENLFISKQGKLVTPPVLNALEGITRNSIIEIARKEFKVEVEESLFTRDQLYIADEVFLSGTAAEVTPIVEVDNRKIGSGKPGELTKKIQGFFFDVARGRKPKYSAWLELVK